MSGVKYLGSVEGKRILEKAKRLRGGISGVHDYARPVPVSEEWERISSSAGMRRAPMEIVYETTPQLRQVIPALIEDHKATEAEEEEALFCEVRVRRVLRWRGVDSRTVSIGAFGDAPTLLTRPEASSQTDR